MGSYPALGQLTNRAENPRHVKMLGDIQGGVEHWGLKKLILPVYFYAFMSAVVAPRKQRSSQTMR